ncbi:MAG TPA: hypothetical protein VLG76_08250 [Rhabdochlamydiaceae bacterium]|nr:hypothetical protein [Rhabdochlamydiaceae bacterium]
MDESIPNQPIEPFDDELESFKEKTTPTFDSLRPPKKPLNKEKLKLFVGELEPVIKGINFLKHAEKEKLGRWLFEISHLLARSRLSQKVKKSFKEFKDQYEAYLTYPEPFDHNTLLRKLAVLEKALS